MARRWAIIAVLALAAAGRAAATTYTVTTTKYTAAPSPYTTAMEISGSITAVTPFAPGIHDLHLPDGNVSAWSFNDGVHTFDPTTSGGAAKLWIDGKGNVEGFQVILNSPAPPNTINQVIQSMNLQGPAGFPADAFAYADVTCQAFYAFNSFTPILTCDPFGAPFAHAPPDFGFAPNFTASAPALGMDFGGGSGINDRIPLRFHLQNRDGAVPITLVAFSDVLPAGMQVAAPANVVNGCGGIVTAVAGSPSIALAGGALDQGTSCDITVDIVVVANGLYRNRSGPVTTNESLPGSPAFAVLALGVDLSVPALTPRGLAALAMLVMLATMVHRRRPRRPGS